MKMLLGALPSNGLAGSEVPWIAMTGIGLEGLQFDITAGGATVAIAAILSASSQARRFVINPPLDIPVA